MLNETNPNPLAANQMTEINLKTEKRINTVVKQSDKTKQEHRLVDYYVIEMSKNDENVKTKKKIAKADENRKILLINSEMEQQTV